MKKCPFCADGFLERKTILETYEYKGQTLTVKQAGDYCNACDEGILSGKDLQETQKQIHDFHAKIDGLLTSDEIRTIRKKLKLTQKQAALIFGGGANAFSRYERGEAMPLRATVNLLKILDKHPEQLQEILE
ncbi:putative zinc finger/helix-turn-helix protein, YgiT family [Beggiatoa alba B18LD]|uniref:Putative zinc finger/helix-turn-helix protein, YgiT family n=1 Tax=Beggiatoa alba B18LD TaxID=395493 RepID=I3CJ57_9GAMM|nr:type II toxin-antitoxin system MqsA family antitoxin [Beggiatoa alba]EIJ43650.1 putative zinc finger/helix-turn-helix protein, YgiT family [Beggiatoa alba B18LD]